MTLQDELLVIVLKHLQGQHDQSDHGRRGISSTPMALEKEPTAIKANTIVNDAPKELQGIIDKMYIADSENVSGHKAGVAPFTYSDGSMISYYNPRVRKTKNIVIHEATHAHQSELVNSNPKRHDYLIKQFESAGRKDLSVKNSLWSESITRDGEELWATAVGMYFGGSRSMLEQSSPNISKLIRDIYQ